MILLENDTCNSNLTCQSPIYLCDVFSIHVISLLCCSDLNCLSSSAPPAAAEWQSLLRPLRGREPEGIWNLLSIVRELLRRQDSNAVPLLEILTDEMLQCEQVSSAFTLFCWKNH